MKRIGLLLGLAAIAACGDDGAAGPDAGSPDAGIAGGDIEPFPELTCPGSAGCEAATGAVLQVGAGRADITPDLDAAETEWTDTDGDSHWDNDEPFVDVNGNGRFDAVWIAGFSTGRPATGVHEPIWVRAIVFDHGNTRVAVAIVDAVGWFATEMDATRALLADSLDIDHLIIGSTHVHETPDTIGLWGRKDLESGVDLDYQAMVRQATADAVADAVAALEPVTMSVAQVLTVDETGSAQPYVSDSRDPVIMDPTLTVIRYAATAEPARTVATMVHWASHPEYFWSRNNDITPDYIHWVRDIVENGAAANETRGLPALEGLGGEVIYVNGAIGGLIYPGRAAPIDAAGNPVTENGLEKAQAAGTNLGRLALESITDAALVVDVADPEVGVRTGRMYVTIENTFYHVAGLVGLFGDRQFLGYDEADAIGPGNFPLLESRVSYLEVGNVGIVTAPGELFPELSIGGYGGEHTYGFELLDPDNPNPPNLAGAPSGPYLKDLIEMNDGIDIALVAGMTEDFLGYIVPDYDYVVHEHNPFVEQAPGDHYEETNSIGPKAEEELVGPMRRLIEWRP